MSDRNTGRDRKQTNGEGEKKGGRQDTIAAGRRVNGVPVGAMMDEAQSQSERLGEEERERREMSERQPGTRREEDRERESV